MEIGIEFLILTKAGPALTFPPRRKENGVGALVLTRGELVLTENGDWGRGAGIDQGRIGTVALTLEKGDWGWGSSVRHDLMVDRKGFCVGRSRTVVLG